MKKITAFEIVRHGIEHSDYFQGCGVSFTSFTDVATGIGDTEAAAYVDALEQLADVYDVAPLEGKLIKPRRQNPGEAYWHVSIRVKGE